MQSKEINNLAEKIARVLEAESRQPELARLFASIEKINERLERLEVSVSKPSKSPIQDLRSAHPSLDRFAIAEAVADEFFNGIQKEKTCSFEPNSKPCDHCSMCSARGF